MEKAAAIDNTMYFMIFSLLKVGCDRSSGDAAHNKAVSRRTAAYTVQAVDTAGNFAGCIEMRNGFAGLRADHLSLIVNADAAHAVVKFRPESHC